MIEVQVSITYKNRDSNSAKKFLNTWFLEVGKVTNAT